MALKVLYDSSGVIMNTVNHRQARALLWAILLATSSVWGQSINLTAPVDDATYPDGDDFATRTLGWPWSMDRLRDIAHDTGYNQPTAAGGIWTATVRDSAAYFFPLSPGFLSTSYSFHPTYYSDGTPYGPLNPVDPLIYKRLAFRASLHQTHRSSVHISWTTDPNVWPSSTSPTDVVGRYAYEDGDPTFSAGGTPMIVRSPSGYRLYDINLASDTWDDGRVPWLILGPTRYFSAWGSSPNIYGLMLWLSTGAPIGSTAAVDWIRLYDPDTSPQVTLRWTTSGISWGNYHSIRIFIDRDNSGYDGDLYLTGLDNSGSYTLLTAALPPGDYYAYLQVVRHENSDFSVVATSPYSGRIRIGHAPTVNFTAPSFTSGVDYATSELNDPWDFSGSSDVTKVEDITGVQYTGGMLDAYGEPADPRIQLNMKKNGVVVPINPQRYRYLTYRMMSDISGTANLLARIERWSTQLTWWNQGLTTDGTYSREIQHLEDFRVYSLDMWDTNLANPLYPYQFGWKTLPQVSYFRFDPLETPARCRFWIDDIKLCEFNHPTDGQYTVRWTAQDLDSAQITIRLFYGSWVGSSYQEQPSPLAVITQAPGPGSFTWDMSALPWGSYYIRGESDDGAHTTSWMSDVPVVIAPSQYFADSQPVRGTANRDWSFITAWNLSNGKLEVSSDWYTGDFTFDYTLNAYQQWLAVFLYDDGTAQTRELRWSYRQAYVR
jgi:hypothetical protein